MRLHFGHNLFVGSYFEQDVDIALGGYEDPNLPMYLPVYACPFRPCGLRRAACRPRKRRGSLFAFLLKRRHGLRYQECAPFVA